MLRPGLCGAASAPYRGPGIEGVHVFWFLFFGGVGALAVLYVWLDARADPRWRRTRDSTDPAVLREHQGRGPGVGDQGG